MNTLTYTLVHNGTGKIEIQTTRDKAKLLEMIESVPTRRDHAIQMHILVDGEPAGHHTMARITDALAARGNGG